MFSIEGQERVSKDGYPSFRPPSKAQFLNQGKGHNMNDKQKKVVWNFVRTLAATVVAALIAWLAGPDVTELIGTGTAVIAVPVLTALLTAAERALRYGNEQGEDKTLSLVSR